MLKTLLVGVVLGTLALGGTYAQAQNPPPKKGTSQVPDKRGEGDQGKTPIYVPVNLEDAFVELKKILPPEVLKKMKEGTEQEMIQYHRSTGMWIRNNWGLWAGSHLAKYFNGLGIHHPDDMSGIILETFWCHLNSKPLRLDERIASSQAYWKAGQEPENKACPDDGSLLAINAWLDDKAEDGSPRVIHVARCEKHKHLWVFEHGKGWYKPTPEQLKRIGED
jgi:hypothetical protein